MVGKTIINCVCSSLSTPDCRPQWQSRERFGDEKWWKKLWNSDLTFWVCWNIFFVSSLFKYKYLNRLDTNCDRNLQTILNFSTKNYFLGFTFWGVGDVHFFHFLMSTLGFWLSHGRKRWTNLAKHFWWKSKIWFKFRRKHDKSILLSI